MFVVLRYVILKNNPDATCAYLFRSMKTVRREYPDPLRDEHLLYYSSACLLRVVVNCVFDGVSGNPFVIYGIRSRRLFVVRAYVEKYGIECKTGRGRGKKGR